jgi:uncharacterized glyoxalase superfamily protein PhnB
MDQVLAIRPFVPARDFALSRQYYAALGFTETHAEAQIAMLKTDSFSFILQNYYMKEFAENCMIQMLVRNADAWWEQARPAALVERFAVKPPRPPAMQEWGIKVGFLFDPSGVLWHVAEVPF